MRRFFRKLRYSFRRRKKFREYLIYASGEIILIVVSILIALQVTNWNLKRIKNKKEKAYIVEFQKSLHQDLHNIDKVLDFNRKKDSCINRCMKLLGTKMENSERVIEIYKLLFGIGNFQVYRPNYAVFNNLISAETIAIITNDSLRICISKYYGNELSYEYDTQQRIKDKTRQFLDTIGPLIMNKEIATAIVGPKFNFEYQSIIENEIQKNQKVFYDLYMMQLNIIDQNNELEDIKKEVENILSIITSVQRN